MAKLKEDIDDSDELPNPIATETKADDNDTVSTPITTVVPSETNTDEHVGDSTPIVPSETDTDEHVGDSTPIVPSEIKEDDWVIVKYQGKFYHGLVLEVVKHVDQISYKVKSMHPKGKYWMWPAAEDICWYKKKNVLKPTLKPFPLTNNSHLYHFSE